MPLISAISGELPSASNSASYGGDTPVAPVVRGKGSMTSYFFNDLLATIVDRGRGIVERGRDRRPSGKGLAGLAEDLLSGSGEATGIALARDIFDNYAALDSAGRTAFFRALAHDFGPDQQALDAMARAYVEDPSDVNALRLHQASEPRRQELIRRLNRAPGGFSVVDTS